MQQWWFHSTFDSLWMSAESIPVMRLLLIISLLAAGCFNLILVEAASSIDLKVYEVHWGFHRLREDSLLVYLDYKMLADGYEGDDVERAVGVYFFVKRRDRIMPFHREFTSLPHSLVELRNATGLVTTYVSQAKFLQPGDLMCSRLQSQHPEVTITVNGEHGVEKCTRFESSAEVTDFDAGIKFRIGRGINHGAISYKLLFGENTDYITGHNMYEIEVFLSDSRDGTVDVLRLSSQYPQIGPNPVIEAGGRLSGIHEQTVTKASTHSHRYLCFTLLPRANITFNYDGELTFCEALPTDNSTCRLWGDPHQKTFDGYGYTFQGECEYIAVETCKNEDGDVEDFRIIVDNFRRRPSKAVTYIRELRLEYNGVAYALTHPNVVIVDGVKVTLPFKDPRNGVFIHYAAPNKVLKTDFGLTIRLDDEHNGDITLSDHFQNKVCGLCGNFDEDRLNECHYRNSTNMNEKNAECKERYSKEWFVEDSCGGVPPPPPPPPEPCEKEEVQRQVEELCSLLTDPSGPFAACHEAVSPKLYAATCEYDGCELHPDTRLPCKSMDMYYYDCQSASDWKLEDLLNWRNTVEQCPPTCPEGMYYNPNGDACPPSCPYPNGYEGTCPFPNMERCDCPYGMVFDGVKCVPPEECGCLLENGRYLSKGDVFVSEDCLTITECVRYNFTQITERPCAENAECTIKNGYRDCYCVEGYEGDGRVDCNTGRKTCHIYGDPHFDTYDNWHYSFQGDCTYIAIRTCRDLLDGYPPFEVLVETDKRVSTERFTWLTAIILNFTGKAYKMNHTGAVTVDGEDIRDRLPFEDEEVLIVQDGDGLVLETSFGLKISYDRRHDALVDIPPAYQGNVCGLCGNADNDRKNEKVKQDGTMASNKLEFANTWGAFQNCPEVVKEAHTCEEGSPEQAIALDSCWVLLQKDGPLASCHDFRDPQGYYKSCIYDLCGTLPSKEQLCKNIEQYVLACRSNGGTPSIDWKITVDECKPVICPDDYTQFQRSCYKYFRDPKNFETAKIQCQSECAHLVTITSTEENAFVGGIAENQTSWIGAVRNFDDPAIELESSGDNINTFVPFRLPKNFGSLKFSVQTEGDAHLILSSFPVIDDGETPLYNFLLGGPNNPTNSFSRCLICDFEADEPGSYVQPDEESIFYVTMKDTVVQIGRDYNRRILIVDEMGRILDIRHVAFRTDGAPGTWKFYTSEFEWVTDEAWTGFNSCRMGEPSNFKNRENCLETNFNGEPGLWNDRSCTTKNAFVCEKEPDTE